MTKNILKSKIMIFILIFVFLCVPQTLNISKQTDVRTVVIAVGIDKEEEQYVLSTQILEPDANQGFKENLQVFTAKGEDVLQAIENMSLYIGKITGFGNASAVVIGNEVAKEGFANIIDFFVRSKRLNDNAVIITTNKKASDLLSKVAKIDNSFGYSINSLSKLNEDFISTSECTLESFLNDYYGDMSASFVAQIRQIDEKTEGISTEDASDSGGDGTGQATTVSADALSGDSRSKSKSSKSGSGEGGSQDKGGTVLSNDGHTSVVVDGKEIAVLTPEQMIGFNHVSRANKGAITIKNVSDNIYNNATVSMSIKNKVFTATYKMENGIPRVRYNVKYFVKVENINQNGKNQNILQGSNTFITETLRKEFIKQVKLQVADSINIAKSLNADLFGAQESFFKFQNKQWKDFIKTLPNKDDAFQKIQFFTNVEVYGEL
ncbi:MAG: hypothetical protein IJX26_00710 [Clostridia bacterium]|nr:hypothetical protein [Clostridia bacterium]